MKPSKGVINLKTNKSYIGYMPQSCRFDDGISAAETIQFFSRLRKADLKQSIYLCEKLKLDMNKKVRHLSPGQQKKLQMVIAMTGEPDLYILDEPTAGLDPNATFEMKSIIKSIHNSGRSIIISSHILQDMDDICTNIAIMESGNLTYNNEIESCYLIKTSMVTSHIMKILSADFKISLDKPGTTLTAKISREQVPSLVNALSLQGVSVFEVGASNVKSIVQKQLHIEEM
jgi:ABC-2 type transport system ATP-binding protein